MSWDGKPRKFLERSLKMSHTYVGILKMLSRESLEKNQFVAHIKEGRL
jgi:hypothetical protein